MAEEIDPGAMDGREIAERLGKLAHDPGHDRMRMTFWCGVAVARLLEYQGKLEKHGLLPFKAVIDDKKSSG